MKNFLIVLAALETAAWYAGTSIARMAGLGVLAVLVFLARKWVNRPREAVKLGAYKWNDSVIRH